MFAGPSAPRSPATAPPKVAVSAYSDATRLGRITCAHDAPLGKRPDCFTERRGHWLAGPAGPARRPAGSATLDPSGAGQRLSVSRRVLDVMLPAASFTSIASVSRTR